MAQARKRSNGAGRNEWARRPYVAPIVFSCDAKSLQFAYVRKTELPPCMISKCGLPALHVRKAAASHSWRRDHHSPARASRNVARSAVRSAFASSRTGSWRRSTRRCASSRSVVEVVAISSLSRQSSSRADDGVKVEIK
jgi:hypothetical protein